MCLILKLQQPTVSFFFSLPARRASYTDTQTYILTVRHKASYTDIHTQRQTDMQNQLYTDRQTHRVSTTSGNAGNLLEIEIDSRNTGDLL